MKNVRLEDIANELNITKVSVSKALRDHKDISEETRKKVKKKAKEMGYHPNLQARSLTSKVTNTIGVIVPKIAHAFFAATIEGIYKAAEKEGYKVILGVSYENEQLEKEHLESMINMRVDGLVVSVTEKTKKPDLFEDAKEMGINLVFFDRGFTDAGFSYVKVNDRESARKGVKHLIGLGYNDVAHLAGYSSSTIGKQRRAGYNEALQEAGLSMSESAIIEGGFSEVDGARGFKILLEQYGKPEAIFAVTYPVGLGILSEMHKLGISPADIPILSFGDSDFNQYLETPFICIDQPNYELGKRAFEQLFKEMKAKEDVIPEMVIMSADLAKKPEWISSDNLPA
ncbi:MAG: LacI family DNA-binding transcriptional regulator [Balneolaceae bacterium]|nr:LacI family DNA-binding transcriptional regulator [Balneolaceae bacterium]